MTRPGYRAQHNKGRTPKKTRGNSRVSRYQRQADEKLRENIEKELQRCKTRYRDLITKSKKKEIVNSSEYVNVSTLLAELEQRLEDVEQMLDTPNPDLQA